MTVSGTEEELIMLSTSDSFADFAARFGAVSTCSRHEFEATQIFSSHKLLIKIAQQMLREERANVRGEILKCDFGFIDEDGSDAFAAVCGVRHGFSLNSDLVTLSYYLSGELFIVRDYRDQFWLTHPHDDFHGNNINLSLTPAANVEYELALHSARVSHIVDKRRVAVAQYFREFFLLFALFHEFHHVIWGHCDFVHASTGATRLHEVGPTDAKVPDDPLMHNIEHLADIGAIDLMIWYVNKRSKLNFKWVSRISYADLHRLALVACGVMCAAWHAEDLRTGRDGSHPEPSARFGNLLAHYAGVMGQSKGEEFFKHKIGKLAMLDLLLLSEVCPELSSVVSGMQEKVSDAAHVEAMQDLFKTYREKTLQYEFRTKKEIEIFAWK